MKRAAALLLLSLGAALGCSDTTEPELRAGTYDLLLTDCAGCATGSTPLFAAAWRDGVFARIAISDVGPDGAQAVIQSLRTTDDVSLLGALASSSFTLTRADDVYQGSVGFAEGTITLTLPPGDCAFDLDYPGVDTGPGSCLLQ